MPRKKNDDDLQPMAQSFRIETGLARIEPDPYSDGGWVLWVNGVQSSHIAEDPARLEFEYMQWIAAGIEHRFTDREAKLNFLHLGGGACSLPRWSLAVYPESRSLVIEVDAALSEKVREVFDLPRAPKLRIRDEDARKAVDGMKANTRDVVIRDVFSTDKTDWSCTTQEFMEGVQRILRPGGLYLSNIGDRAELKDSKQEMATALEVFEHVAVIADPAMFKGRRSGNFVLMAADEPIQPDAQLAKVLRGSAVPAQVWDTEKVREYCAGASVRLDKDDPAPGETPEAERPALAGM
ncbi:spermidine synthase [Arthrobacter sp. UM1]|uniref:spermidine synthase n=1 Tax=Arthrobacter sp. UM1 TaxID=2766776 RepID=UPI001CF6D944|nr:fused MFS/spermidine synthase [Arthrobacter sp. UM1]